MIDTKRLEWLFVVNVHCLKCIRFCRYSDALRSSVEELWTYTQQCYFETAVVHWCNVFGAYSEHTHYTRFFSDKELVLRTGDKLSKIHVRSRILKAAHMSYEDYDLYQKNVKTCRDQYFTHTDLKAPDQAKIPDTNVMMNTALEMRSIIRDVFLHGDYDTSGDGESYYRYAKSYPNGNECLCEKLDLDVAKLRNMV